MAAANDGQQETHRPGAFKQQNKSHKTGRHRSKGQVDKQAKGRRKHERNRVELVKSHPFASEKHVGAMLCNQNM